MCGFQSWMSTVTDSDITEREPHFTGCSHLECYLVLQYRLKQKQQKNSTSFLTLLQAAEWSADRESGHRVQQTAVLCH